MILPADAWEMSCPAKFDCWVCVFFLCVSLIRIQEAGAGWPQSTHSFDESSRSSSLSGILNTSIVCFAPEKAIRRWLLCSMMWG